jgi:hypothetical protein
MESVTELQMRQLEAAANSVVVGLTRVLGSELNQWDKLGITQCNTDIGIDFEINLFVFVILFLMIILIAYNVFGIENSKERYR